MKVKRAAIFMLVVQCATLSTGLPVKSQKASVVPVNGKWAERGRNGRLEFPDTVSVELQKGANGNRKMQLKKQPDTLTKTANRLLNDRGFEQITAYSDPEGGFSVVVSGNGEDFDVVGVVYEEGIECMLVGGVVTCPDEKQTNATYLSDMLDTGRGLTADAKKTVPATGDVNVEMCVTADYQWYLWVESLGVVRSGTDAYVTSILLLTAIVNEVNEFYKGVGDGVFNLNFVPRDIDVITSDEAPTFANDPDGDGDTVLSEALFRDLRAYAAQRFDLSICDTVAGLTGLKLTLRNFYALGIAYLEGTCDDATKYSITSTKFQLILTLVHELGHALGALHDDPNFVSDPECYNKEYIMWYSTYELGTEVWNQFSSCSKAAIKAFVESDRASCLRVDTFDEEVYEQQQCVEYIGDKLTILEQCRELNSETSKVCEENFPSDKTKLCDTELPLCGLDDSCFSVILHDGTACGANKICVGGECVRDNRDCKGVEPLDVPTQSPCPDPITCCTSSGPVERARCCSELPGGCTCDNC